MKDVEGYSAIGWICDECGAQNYADMVSVECTEEDLDMQPELADGEYLMAPETVKCKECGERFRMRYGEPEEQE